MPSKHIDEATWRKVEQETVNAVISTHVAFKHTEILKLLIEKGLQHINEDDYKRFAERKGRR